jgi:hypothetical protein
MNAQRSMTSRLAGGGPLGWVTAAVALAAALVYLLIGLEVVYIGEARDGAAGDILGFGLSSAAAYVGVALVALFVHRRWALVAASVFVALTIGMYFAVSGVREPPFEIWGLLVKVLQVVVLGGLIALAVRGRAATSAIDRPAAAGRPA